MTTDLRGRGLRDLRVSLTDRCNFRCGYCMPREIFGPGYAFLPDESMLSFDEIDEIVRAAAGLGVRKVRLTGGEPLLRRGMVDLVSRLARIDGLELAMTTNGVLLPRFASALAAAGLDRVTVSLDALDDETFRAASDTKFDVADVLEGIDAAEAAGLGPVKINTVVRRGLNDSQVADLVDHFRWTPHVIRFIEYMDVGATNGWRLDEVMPADHILDAIAARWPVEELPARTIGEVARRYRLQDGSCEFGLISPVSQPFCGNCTRGRITADGRFHTCLFSPGGVDLMSLLRGPRRPDDLAETMAGVWHRRSDNYSETRGRDSAQQVRPVEMSYIGG